MAEDRKENQMTGGIPVRLRGLDANGNSISPTIEETKRVIGIDDKRKIWSVAGWHRIIIGATGGILGAGIVTITQDFNHAHGGGLIFSFIGSGYLNPSINILGKIDGPFTKIRVLTRQNANDISLYVDVYYSRNNLNVVTAYLSNSTLNISLTDFVDEVVDIPEGFTSTEFNV